MAKMANKPAKGESAGFGGSYRGFDSPKLPRGSLQQTGSGASATGLTAKISHSANGTAWAERARPETVSKLFDWAWLCEFQIGAKALMKKSRSGGVCVGLQGEMGSQVF